ncbi:uncharacterized protein LOC115314015 isoform X1 [Ixodes scapularis]|uniref:uncharacterized protein LOC115314015 isoform X1 n=1 Tax=Ixodes scapularis TaxID=6945 RepID=UPI001A9CC36E|nr:uncharacterized protein LOC115314015 isoform X1 [Ixodes scapularis]
MLEEKAAILKLIESCPKSGRDSTPGMRPRPNHLLFVIQVLSSWVLRPADDGGFTTFPASYNGWDIIDETACSDHVGACGFPLVLTAAGTFHLATPFYVRVAPVSSTSPEPSCNAPFANLVSGRDSTPGMRPRPNHLLFVIQVGKDRFYFDVKSNNVCLVVLPRLRAFLKCVADCFDSLCLIVLLLSGDVELNPGPFSETQLAAILDGQRALNASISSIGDRLDEHIRQTNQRLSSIETKVEGFSQLVPNLERCENLVKDLGCRAHSLGSRISYLENAGKRNNIVVYGVAESEAETPALLNEKVILEIF